MTVQAGPWAEDVFARAKALWPTTSASEISRILANEFGVSVSRCAVTGKMDRHDIKKDKQHEQISLQRAPRSPKPHRPTAAKHGEQVPRPPKPYTPQTPAEIEPRFVAFADLRSGECRFECSGTADVSEFTFCGHITQRLGVGNYEPYCPAHAKVCYLPDVDRRRQDRQLAKVAA